MDMHRDFRGGGRTGVSISGAKRSPRAGREAIALAVIALAVMETLESRTLLAAAPTFGFTLPDTERTSAGVFKADGTLVRTLWSGVSYDAGTYTKAWDGLDDWGNRVADGDYQVRVLTNNVTYTWEGVIGNTSNSQTDSTVWKSYDSIGALAIAGNTAYYANGYPEVGSTSGRFSVSSPNAGKTLIATKGGDTWNVATDGTKVYWSGYDYINHSTYVFATAVSNDAQVSFSSGQAYTPTYGVKLNSVIDKRTDGAAITGLAVQNSGSYLFVSHAASNILDVVNKTTGAVAQTITNLAGPGSMAIDGNDKLWIEVLNGSTPQIRQYTVESNGTLTFVRNVSGTFSSPLAMAVSPAGELVVVDGGSSQQLKAFSVASGSASWTFGQSGGYTTSPTVTNDKFMFEIAGGTQGSRAYAGIAFQSDGSFWLTDMGNDRVQHYDANRNYLDRIQYLSASYFCSIDQNNPTRLFSDYLEFQIDYSKPLHATNGSWTLARNWANAVPSGYGGSFRGIYPQTLSNGRTYALLPRSSDGKLRLFELTSAGTMRDTGILTSTASAGLQPDGSLRTINAPGVGGTLTWTKSTLTGFNSSNNPIYSASAVLATAPAGISDPVWRGDNNHIRPGIQTTGDILISYNHAFAGTADAGYHLGGVRIGGSDWLWRTSMATHSGYQGDYPTDGSFDIGNDLWYAGSVAMTLDHNVFWGYYGEHYKSCQTNMFAHYNDDGLFVSTFGVVGADVGGNAGGVTPAAGMAGNAINPWVVKTADGTGYLYHNDESWHAGVHRWRIDGLDSIAEQTTSITLSANATAGLHAEYFDSADLSSLNSMTVRSDNAVNFAWGSGIPGGTALTAGDTYSVRWDGFVTPLYSQTYTFYTNCDGGARLWVNGKLIVDKWTASGEQSGTITLSANTSYQIRMEYRHTTGTASASLSWSSSSQSKQIVPQSRLSWLGWHYPAATTTVDLMDGLKFDTTVENGMYGWTRNGATDTTSSGNKWTVGTSNYSASKTDVDLSMSYFRDTSGASSSVTRDLGVASASTVQWTLSGSLNYAGNNPNHSTRGGQYFEVLDDAGKIIAQFYPLQYTYPTDDRLYANTQVLVSLTSGSFDALTDHWQPFQISATGGNIRFNYAGYELTTGVFDATSDWKRAATLRCRFFTAGTSYNRAISLKDLTFTATAAIAAPSNLSASASSLTGINLTWTDNSSNETGFKVDRATNSSFTAGLTTISMGANVTSYSGTGLSSGTTYYYRVRATSSGGDSFNSKTALATTLSNGPAAPSGLTAAAVSSSQINLSWTDNSSDETGFKIDRATDSGFTQDLTTATVGANITSYSSTGLSTGITYYYRVRATNSGGESANTSTASAKTSTSSNLSDRTGWTATASVSPAGSAPGNALDGDMATRWTTWGSQGGQWIQVDMGSAQTFNKIVLDQGISAGDSPYLGYALYLSNDGTNWGSAVATGTGTADETVITLDSQTARYLKVVDTGAAGTGGWWSIHELYVYSPASSGSGLGTIGEEIWTGISGTDIASIPTGTTPNQTATLTSLEIPSDAMDNYGVRIRGYFIPQFTGTYYFWISSDDNGELWLSTNSSPASKQLIAKVTNWTSSREWNKEASQKSSGISLTAGTAYYIETLMKEGSVGDNLAVAYKIDDSSNPTNGAATNIIPGSLLAPYAGEPVVPTAPSVLTATAASASQINLTWTDNSSDETGFKIERATNSGFTQNLTLVTTTAADVTSYSNTGLAANTTYYYRVRATNTGVDSADSNAAGPVLPLLQINGDQDAAGQSDQIRVARNASDPSLLDVFLNSGAPTYSVSFASLYAISVNGLGGEDTLTLDLANGAVIPAGGMSYDGGTQTIGDSLIITGASGSDTVAFTTSQVTINSRVAALTSVENRSFSGVQHLGSLTLAGGSKLTLPEGGQSTLVVQSLSVDATSSLDVADNAVIVDYTGSNPFAGIYPLVASSAANHWVGNGIVSHTAAGGGSEYAIGVADNGVANLASFAGQTVDATSVLIRFTYSGDANLDGQVDLTDLSILAGSWQMPGRQWGQGDSDYSGSVDLTDLSLLASNWQKVLPAPVAAEVVTSEVAPASQAVDAAPAADETVVAAPTPVEAVPADPILAEPTPAPTTPEAAAGSTAAEAAETTVAPPAEPTAVPEAAAVAPVAPVAMSRVWRSPAPAVGGTIDPVPASPVTAAQRSASLFSNRPLSVLTALVPWPITRQRTQVLLSTEGLSVSDRRDVLGGR